MAHKPSDFTVVVEDESIFTWEVKTKKIWAKKGSKQQTEENRIKTKKLSVWIVVRRWEATVSYLQSRK